MLASLFAVIWVHLRSFFSTWDVVQVDIFQTGGGVCRSAVFIVVFIRMKSRNCSDELRSLEYLLQLLPSWIQKWNELSWETVLEMLNIAAIVFLTLDFLYVVFISSFVTLFSFSEIMKGLNKNWPGSVEEVYNTNVQPPAQKLFELSKIWTNCFFSSHLFVFFCTF